jgi:hypothetical protein
MDLKSKELIIESSSENLSKHLSVPANLRDFLPNDRVDKWVATDQGCSFQIKNLAQIELKLDVGNADIVVYKSVNDKPFSFQLNLATVKISETQCTLQISMQAEINAMMSMMLSGPLGNFIQSLADSVKAKYGSV